MTQPDTGPRPERTRLPPSLQRCVSIDLETGVETREITALAGLRADSGDSVHRTREGSLQQHLAALDQLADGADFLLGHNITAHDLPFLDAAKPSLHLLNLPVLDTLRINPLAFPQHPYHHLVKHYKDGDLARETRNNPLLDSALALDVFGNQVEKFRDADPALLAIWHHLCGEGDEGMAYDLLFRQIRQAGMPSEHEAQGELLTWLEGKACPHKAREKAAALQENRWETAYALAWISVAGGNSAVPPWVLHNHPGTMAVIEELREKSCPDRNCPWCSQHNSAASQLKRWFNFEAFRPYPAGEDGRPLQEVITQRAMDRQHTLGILPTGTGKSVCYQVPALTSYDATGKLTVVISPLVALMADQLRGLEQKGIVNADTINGMLTMPERAEALDRVRLGETAVLIISPEQLRSRTVAQAISHRAVAAWVMDESHCLAQWGHDFRPDYRYVTRFMTEHQITSSEPTIQCLTATAKPEVRSEIVEYFQANLNVGMDVVDGGAQRRNLEFIVIPTTDATRQETIHQLVSEEREINPGSGIIVYCQTIRQTEDLAEALAQRGIPAEYFHSRVTTERKKEIQEGFSRGESNIIISTSAFGMGIDRPSVTAVIHASVPGSLENYMQEAGRAGRDGKPARCILLFQPADIERQFSMNARNRLDRNEISAVLRALRRMKRKVGPLANVETTAGELIREDQERDFQRDDTGPDNRNRAGDGRLKTAVAWLEEAELVTRTHNASQIYASTLLVNTVSDGDKLLASGPQLSEAEQRQAQSAISRMVQAEPDDVISTDEMCSVTGASPPALHRLFARLKEAQVVNQDISMTAFVSKARNRPSIQRFQEANRLEEDLVRHLQEMAPDQQVGERQTLNLRAVNQAMRDQEHGSALPELISRMLRSMGNDGAPIDNDEDPETASARGSLRVRSSGHEKLAITLNRSWTAVERGAKMRRQAALRILQTLVAKTANETNRADIMVQTSESELDQALRADLELNSQVKDWTRLKRSALLWLHEQEIVRLNNGFSVLRHAITVEVPDGDQRKFTQGDFVPLQLHYDHQTLQVHIIAAYGETGLREKSHAAALAADYFTMPEDDFIRKWMADRQDTLGHQTSRESYQRIVGNLNRSQRSVVTDDRVRNNTLILAGPGSGKTRTLVHRIAYLVRVKRVRPDSIIALAYNRHAAVQIRQRLQELIGDDARGVLAMTLHALAMRLTGRSFAQRTAQATEQDFDEALLQAAALLQDGDGDGEPEQDDEIRDRLLGGFRWIMVDEYQDIGESEYQLISALAGRSRAEEETRINLLAVGDDDQNIYSFKGTSNQYIQRFQQDYKARPAYLTENYRSTAHITAAANCVIEAGRGRMKEDHPITINRARRRDDPGGRWQDLDPVTRGQVQLLNCPADTERQAMAAVAELQRLRNLEPDAWSWSRCAVIGRHWEDLDPVRSMCILQGIPTHLVREDLNAVWLLRETQALMDWARTASPRELTATAALLWLEGQEPSPWNMLLASAMRLWLEETDNTAQDWPSLQEWLAEWCRDNRQRQQGLLLSTAHSAKGLEFDHVLILDGRWEKNQGIQAQDADRRLYYVAMTRARETLTLMDMEAQNAFADDLELHGSATVRDAPDLGDPPPELAHRYHWLDLKKVFLSYAGYQPPDSEVHRRIAALNTGDPLAIDQKNTPWTLLNEEGNPVGKLAQAWQPPAGHRPIRAEAMAMIRWTAEKSEPEYRRNLKAETWETVIPEIVTAPGPDCPP